MLVYLASKQYYRQYADTESASSNFVKLIFRPDIVLAGAFSKYDYLPTL